ncbi:MAG: type IV pilus modification PilV family protein [Thermoguttaceae bacterium]
MNRCRIQRGFILHEALMAVGLSMALVVAAAQLLVMAAQQRRLARQYAAATLEAGNLMEEMISRTWDDSNSQSLAKIELPDHVRRDLPGASLSVDVADEDRQTRRITLRLQWQSGAERARESVRLVAWKFLSGEEGA